LSFDLKLRVLEERIEIDAGADRVWDVLADFGDVASWAPYMRYSALVGEQRSGVGTRRRMRHAWGFRFEERVTQWHERHGYSFDVLKAPFPMRDVKETWALTSADGRTVLATQVRYGMKLGPIGRLLDWALVRFIVRREMRAGLRGLKTFAERRPAR
jgi:ligand-binding SRPBCC domain-containing protein